MKKLDVMPFAFWCDFHQADTCVKMEVSNGILDGPPSTWSLECNQTLYELMKKQRSAMSVSLQTLKACNIQPQSKHILIL